MSNSYADLLRLLPQEPLQTGEIVAVDSLANTVTVTLPGDATLTLRGSGQIGQRVFFKEGAVQGLAPNLQYVQEEC